MTDRYNALVVSLEHDLRGDDAESLINAIKQFRGVIGVAGNVSDLNTHTAELRAKNRLALALQELLS